jgi:B-cell receptor-associated protein 31
MSFQWTFLATFLYCELIIVAILLLPFIPPTLWQKFFKSRLAKAFHAGAKYYFNFIICIFGLLFLDSIRELRKYSVPEAKDLNTPHAEAHAHMKQFRSQRNFYIAGFALFLWFVIKRLINLLSNVAREMADSVAARKQAEGAHRHLEGLATNDPAKLDPREIPLSTGNAPRYIDPKEHDAEIEKFKQESLKAREDMDALREQYDNSIKIYDTLNEEHRKLQNKLSVLSTENESEKDK